MASNSSVSDVQKEGNMNGSSEQDPKVPKETEVDEASDDVPASNTGAKKRSPSMTKYNLPDTKVWSKLVKATQNWSEKDRLNALGEKYNEIFADNKRIFQITEQWKREVTHLQRERDMLKADQNRNILAKGRLESICRELQRQNKQIKEENLTRVREEETKRKLTAAEMSEKLNDITEKMEKSSVNTLDLQKENSDMHKRLIELNEMLNQRGTHLEQMMREVDLQKQLSEAIIAKMETERKLERSVWEEERARLTSNLEKSEDNCTKLQESLNTYQSKYSEIEGAMLKSNDIFVRFKTDFDKMSKRITELEKESGEWKAKFYGTMTTVVNLTESNEAQSRQIVRQKSQVECLETLCRRFQNERAAYLKQLKEHNVEIPTVPEEPTPPKPAKLAADFSTFTMKERDLKEMKKQLEELQKVTEGTGAQASTSGNGETQKVKRNKKTKKTEETD